MKRSDTIDILRGLAISSVVGIHLLSSYPAAIYAPNITGFFFLVLNQLLRFSVPLFVALSGYMLTAKYKGQTIDVKEFYSKRFKKILLLYLFWSLVIYIVLSASPVWSQYNQSIFHWQTLLFGRADYHLYFVPMIFQLYLIFPLLHELTHKRKMITVFATFTLQLAVLILFTTVVEHRLGHAAPGLNDQKQYLFAGSWFFYFVLGMLLAQVRLTKIWRHLISKIAPIILLLALSWVVFDAITLINEGFDIIIATRFTRIPVFVFANSVIIAALLGRYKLFNLLPQNISRFLSFLGRESFVIFLSHTLLLRILFAITNHTQPLTITLASLIFVVTAFFVSQHLLQKPNIHKFFGS